MTAHEHRLYAFFHLAAHTGARRGELPPGWGDPLFPDTPSSLMPKLIETHNKQNPRAQLPPTPACTTSATSTPRPCSWPTSPFTSSRPRLGHADPAITLRVYAHVIHEQAASAADVFAKAVNG
ncbi:hypothetical protein [Nonomuraea sp. NPDC005650]|uniref:hypothetical protein n=1 Tax=Nonomuraea sp. NPDC005650 TaxID=3157045 RepID=UPI0033ADDBA2